MFGPIEVFESQAGGLFGQRPKRKPVRVLEHDAGDLRGRLAKLLRQNLSDEALLSALSAILKAARPEPTGDPGFESLANRLRGKGTPALESRGAVRRSSLAATAANLRAAGYSALAARGGY